MVKLGSHFIILFYSMHRKGRGNLSSTSHYVMNNVSGFYYSLLQDMLWSKELQRLHCFQRTFVNLLLFLGS